MENVEYIAERFEEAVETIRGLSSSGTWPKGFHTSMPETLSVTSESFNAEAFRIALIDSANRPNIPTSRQIDRLDEVMVWQFYISVEERKIVWARARHRRWKKIAKDIHKSVRTAQRRWTTALMKISYNVK